jgi:hypothetical protein
MTNGYVMEYRHWLRAAPPGEVFTYHIGNLACDRVLTGESNLGFIRALQLDELAKTVWDDQEMGYVELFQSRLGEYRYAYEARRTSEAFGQVAGAQDAAPTFPDDEPWR